MEYDTGFAKRTFPANATMIDALAASDDSFRELCHDFSVADELMRNWEASSAPERDERHAECVDLVDSLRNEIKAILETSRVIPLRPRH